MDDQYLCGYTLMIFDCNHNGSQFIHPNFRHGDKDGREYLN
jgi:hypothetical protein